MHIRRARHDARISPKYKGIYGKPVARNDGLPQWSKISAIRFVIYMGDAMGDFEALERRPELPYRKVQDRPTNQAEDTPREQAKGEEDEQKRFRENTIS